MAASSSSRDRWPPHAGMRVVINASLIPGETGGVEQATSSLIASLGRLTDGDDEYVALVDPRAPGWLDRCAGGNTRIVVRSATVTATRRRVAAVTRKVPQVHWALYRARQQFRPTGVLAPLDPLVESLRPDVVHFPYQTFHATTAPSIFNPWDLQHEHHPEFFSTLDLKVRRRSYRAWCDAATVVEVASHQTKLDLVHFLGLQASKILVVPRAAPTTLASPPAPGELDGVRRTYELPEEFLFYPAQTWPHKNHISLLRAMKLLEERDGATIYLVCCGRQNDFWPAIEAEVRSLGLQDRVRFLGFVTDEYVRALYRLATATVFPTLFEGGGLPALEALSEGSALACSDIPVLTNQVRDAAALFDPTSVESIATALRRVWTDQEYRSSLVKRGKAIQSEKDWDTIARTYRALYRSLADHPLTCEEHELLRGAREDSPLGARTTSGRLP